jgi:hypothetical protein
MKMNKAKMESFKSNNNIKSEGGLKQKTEAFYKQFRKQFVDELFSIIVKYYPGISPGMMLNSDLNLYANEIISSAETVLLKDKDYTEERLQEELNIMNRLVVKDPIPGQNTVFVDLIHKKAKETMVNAFPEVFDLSSDGLRLLEKYSKMYNWEFVVEFYSKHTSN